MTIIGDCVKNRTTGSIWKCVRIKQKYGPFFSKLLDDGSWSKKELLLSDIDSFERITDPTKQERINPQLN